jgi:hypothetical protein
MKARIQNGIVVEILQALPGHAIEDCFHPSILLQCVDFEENMEVGQPLPVPQTDTEPQ